MRICAPRPRKAVSRRGERGARHRKVSSMAGITLIELVVAIAIGAVLLMLGVSAFSGVVARSARVAEVNGMIAHLGYARSEAVLRAGEVMVCPLAGGDPDAGCLADRGAWADGYGVIAVPSGEILRVVAPADSLRIMSNVDGFVFGADGTLQGAAGGRIDFCAADDHARADSARAGDVVAPRRLIVSGPGRVRLAEGVDIDCG
jgi:type IV fimbrial biogenesis protein FimT